LETTAPPIQLTFGVTKEGQTDSVVPVRWCISKRLTDHLQDLKASNPHVLLAVSHGGMEVQRYLVPLMPPLHHIGFSKVGVSKVHATIVWDAQGDVGQLRKTIFAKDSEHGRKLNLLTYQAAGIQEYLDWRTVRHPGETHRAIDVPAKMFAPKPRSSLVWRWANLPFSGSPRDQCDFRKRCLIMTAASVVLGPVVFLSLFLMNLIKLGVLVGMSLCGTRNINYGALSPLKTPDELWHKRGTSRWLTDTEGRSRNPLLIAYCPPALLLALAVLVMVNVSRGWEWPLGFLAVTTLLLPVIAVVALGALGWFLGTVVGVPLAALWRGHRQRRESEAERRRRERDEVYFAELEMMACNGYREASLGALPRDQRTLRLRFYDLKSKVCRPYAR
jgi:hypothetical protein